MSSPKMAHHMELDDIERIVRKVIREELEAYDKNQNQLFTIDEAAYLKVSRGTIYNLMKPNKHGEVELVHVVVTGNKRFRRKDLEKLTSGYRNA